MTDPATYPPVSTPLNNVALLDRLNHELEQSESEVEFYFVGGAVMFQSFNARPSTAHVSALFRPARVVRTAIDRVGDQAQAAADWLPKAVRMLLAEGPDRQDYLTLSHLSVFTPLPAYVLAVKCAAMRLGDDFTEEEDVRYVLRAMNISSAAAAMSIITRYFSERQLAPHTRATLERLLGA